MTSKYEGLSLQEKLEAIKKKSAITREQNKILNAELKLKEEARIKKELQDEKDSIEYYVKIEDLEYFHSFCKTNNKYDIWSEGYMNFLFELSKEEFGTSNKSYSRYDIYSFSIYEDINTKYSDFKFKNTYGDKYSTNIDYFQNISKMKCVRLPDVMVRSLFMNKLFYDWKVSYNIKFVGLFTEWKKYPMQFKTLFDKLEIYDVNIPVMSLLHKSKHVKIMDDLNIVHYNFDVIDKDYKACLIFELTKNKVQSKRLI